MKLFVQEGRTMKVFADAAKTSGDVEEFADSIGVWFNDVPNGSSGEVLMEGVVSLPKNTSVAFTQGQKVFWDTAADELTATDTDKPAGLVWADAATADVTASIKLNTGVQVGTEAG